jgi:hypothetical protein
VGHTGQEIDFGAWCDYFTFDAMGILAFDYNFNMMSDGKSHPPIPWKLADCADPPFSPDGPRTYSGFIRNGLKIMHILANVPWICPIAAYLPVGDRKTQKDAVMFKQVSRTQYAERRTRGTEPNDLFSHLIDNGNKTG